MKQVLQQFIINSGIVGAAARIESQGRREHPSGRASRTPETSRPNSPGRASAYSAVISSLVGGESVSGSSPAAPSEGGAVVEPEGAVVPEPELAGSAAPPDDREELPEAIALTAPVANSPRRLRRPTDPSRGEEEPSTSLHGERDDAMSELKMFIEEEGAALWPVEASEGQPSS